MGKLVTFCGTCDPCDQGCCCQQLNFRVRCSDLFEVCGGDVEGNHQQHIEICWTASPCVEAAAEPHGGIDPEEGVEVYLDGCPDLDDPSPIPDLVFPWVEGEGGCFDLNVGPDGPLVRPDVPCGDWCVQDDYPRICIVLRAVDGTEITRCIVCPDCCEVSGSASSLSSPSSDTSSSSSSESSTPPESSSSSSSEESSSSSSEQPSSSSSSGEEPSSSSSSGCPVDCCCVDQLDVTFEQTIACHTVSVPTADIAGYPGYIADRQAACEGELSASALLGILWDCESKTGISANYGSFECRLYQQSGAVLCGTLLATFTGMYYAYITCDLVNGWTVEIRVVPDQESHPELGLAVVISGKFTAQSGVTFDPTRGLGSPGVVGDTGSATIIPCIDCPRPSSSSTSSLG